MKPYLSTLGNLALLFCFTADSAAAQAVRMKNEPNTPLQIESFIPEFQESGKRISGTLLAVRNTGKVPCVAFAVYIRLKFTDGKVSRITIAEDRAALGIKGETSGIAPGEHITNTGQGGVTSPSGASIESAEAYIDYVEMEDGTVFGPDEGKFRTRFSMLRATRQHERKRLEKIYREKGFNELLKEIQRP
ncbi:MAG: hypothetical protein HYR58_08340 [Acidobacteria bacterium]|nr:hypothetical protein [Acidobacteriota bacterium]